MGRGHEVAYAFSGCRTPTMHDWTFLPRWSRHVRNGLEYYGLRNPRSVGLDSNDPTNDIDNADADSFIRLASRLRPDLIHIHSFVGLPLASIAKLALVAPIIVSVHEFGLVCQRRVLVQKNNNACTTFATQVDCPSCVEPFDRTRVAIRKRLAGTFSGRPLDLVHRLEEMTGKELSVEPKADENVRSPLLNTSQRESRPWRDRLDFAVEALNRNATAVLAVSSHVREVLVQCGMAPGLVEVVHIGSSSAESLTPMSLPSEVTGEVTFLYMSGLVPHKGAHVLLEAWSSGISRSRLIIAGGFSSDYGRAMRAKAPVDVEFFGRYDSRQRVDLLRRSDVVVAPVVGPDTSPQVVLEALAARRPVLASRIGGIPDFVCDGINGLLVEPGNTMELAAALAKLSAPDQVSRLAQHASSLTTVKEHIEELETRYSDALAA